MLTDPKLDSEARQDASYWRYADSFDERPCDAPDPECLCDRCREERKECHD